ncbi:MAG: hypothetical protein LLG04_07605 [Parachlamydia sp.]|nr:hypothetical protein [Parachlamydia sp.]
MNDLMRKLIDMAVSTGRKRQSKQTGYVHYHYHEEEPHQTIPIAENLYFALALFRTRTVENIEEAKTLLERLLHFQNPQEGNFPIYLHEYPACPNRYTGVQLLIPLYWITAQFQHILGNGLKQRLDQSVRQLLRYCIETDAKAALPPQIALKMAAAIHSFGKLWGDDALYSQGQDRLAKISADLDSFAWKSPSQISDMLPALHLIAPVLENSPWHPIWEWLEQTWHRHLLAYVGPAALQWQEGREPQATLYDLCMGTLSGALSTRALQDSIVHLQAALIQPTEEKLPPAIYPRRFPDMFQHAKYAISVINQESEWPKATDRSFHRLHISWGTPKQLHTLVCPGGNIVQCAFQHSDNGVEMVTTLGAPQPEAEREKARELCFYINQEAVKKITVGDLPATTFRMSDTTIIQSDVITIRFSFKQISGNGDFLGHIMPGNRPAQLCLKGANRYHAFDWQLFLRTLRRSDECRIQATLEIEENSDG